MRVGPRIARTEARCLALRTTKAFASTEGAACTQTLTECGVRWSRTPSPTSIRSVWSRDG